MKYSEGYIGSKAELAEFVKKIIPNLFSKRLSVEGQTVDLPSDKDLDYKVKYDISEEGGSFSLKVSWENVVEEESEDIEVDVD